MENQKKGIEDLLETKVTRRSLIKRIAVHGFLIGTAADYMLREDPLGTHERLRELRQSTQFTETEVSPYALDILRAAERSMPGVHSRSLNDFVMPMFAIGAMAGAELNIRRNEDLSGLSRKKFLKRMFYEVKSIFFADRALNTRRALPLASAGIASANRAADNKSTVDAANVITDPRFEEYGFNRYVVESNPTLSYHPTPAEITSRRAVLYEVGLVVASFFIPSLGFGLAGTTPLVYQNNQRTAAILKKGYEIGDKVKEMTKDTSEAEVRKYLSLQPQRL